MPRDRYGETKGVSCVCILGISADMRLADIEANKPSGEVSILVMAVEVNDRLGHWNHHFDDLFMALDGHAHQMSEHCCINLT